ncbi:unnamed protein product [Paramecium octaurelia]|uniref:Uncharacterized protein n=1 Tax=Paramecium octaurelia TaxID=43137 RepID=A0A8S1WXV3_PAROT|nr:unnamed protein product [Paramecium octaurelia]
MAASTQEVAILVFIKSFISCIQMHGLSFNEGGAYVIKQGQNKFNLEDYKKIMKLVDGIFIHFSKELCKFQFTRPKINDSAKYLIDIIYGNLFYIFSREFRNRKKWRIILRERLTLSRLQCGLTQIKDFMAGHKLLIKVNKKMELNRQIDIANRKSELESFKQIGS